MPPEAEINIVNLIIATTCVSPLKRPGAVRSRDRPTYTKRKQSEVQKAVAENVRNKIRRAYNQCDASGNSAERKCSFCEQWTESFRQAYAASTTPQERYQLLTLLPSTLAKHEIKKLIPEASMYEINKSRKLKENHGVWYRPDPFTRHKVSPECVSAALAKWIVHNHIRKTQGKAIYEEKQCTERGSIVFDFDFAENWTVVLPAEVQAYHWKKQQVSVFTCVVTTKKSTESFAMVSDDSNHDSAHACLALKKATEWVDDNLPVYSKVTYVTLEPPVISKIDTAFTSSERAIVPIPNGYSQQLDTGKTRATELEDSSSIKQCSTT
ncbi:hypothetical protein HPB49_010188 [Dermacentor silvarum]|uniref:Uncharacterized protein n=1 Tax=Dermacentor silvarum TaxID=543639 RepID=A0ACB8CEF2_DERSI|nr:hypothetical protein HPB49_010188 [Dermacentor silvarum]